MTIQKMQLVDPAVPVGGSTRPPLPPFTSESAVQRFVWRKMVGIRVIQKRWLWPTQSTRAGETGLSL